MKIKFHLPDFYGNYRMNLLFADEIRHRPEFFYDNIEIASSYGCFPPALWNGGRTVVGAVRREKIDYIIKEYNSRGIPIRYTFTNPLVTESDLNDPFCNMITKAAHNGLNEIIVNKPCLEEYIRKKYPKYPIISSTVKQIENLDDLNAELLKDYKLVVLDYNWNHDYKTLEAIEKKDKIELLINPYCTPNCKRRKAHYEYLGKIQRIHNESVFGNNPSAPVINEKFSCPNMSIDFYRAGKLGNFITNRQIYEKLYPMGYSNFKIEGRMVHAADILESFCYYLIKPEYRDELRLKYLKILLERK